MASCTDISKVQPGSGELYFFDANVWLTILDGYYQKHYTKPYIDFFSTILSGNFEKKPQILMASLLLSEIVNRLLRDVHFVDFKAKNATNLGINQPNAFKQIYRKDAQYARDNKIIFQNVKSYQQVIKLIDDNFESYRLKDVINDNTTSLDFNDYVYSKLVKKHKATIITNDIDFSGLSLNILTANQKLIKRFKG